MDLLKMQQCLPKADGKHKFKTRGTHLRTPGPATNSQQLTVLHQYGADERWVGKRRLMEEGENPILNKFFPLHRFSI